MRTLIADTDMTDAGNDHSLPDYFKAWKKYWDKAFLKNGQFLNMPHAELSEERKLATSYMTAQYRSAYGRKFFTTEHGYMGLSSSRVCKGDVVALLYGGRTPYILRRTRRRVHGRNGACEFIGE